MSTHKHFDKLCCIVIVLAILLTILFINISSFVMHEKSNILGYENKLFDTSTVHTLNIVMDNWDDFTANCQNEEYYDCTIVIDDEIYRNVAIRGKGNTSLSQVPAYGNDRYSFKIEFDHYDDSNTYHGLDKLCLNNIIQDNTYMKDYLTYQMMAEMGVAAPLCSYVNITVNNENRGLYLAVEGVEESFLKRNFRNNYGELYKPDSMKMGGGRGNGKQFDMEKFMEDADLENFVHPPFDNQMQFPVDGMKNSRKPDINRADNELNNSGQEPGMPTKQKPFGGMMGGSDDVLLKYIDDEPESYPNIFDNAKTDVSDSDKARLIGALKNLSNNENLQDTVDIEKVIRYFVVHNFVVNFDSYTGSIIHNYYLYEDNGKLQMIPWDYNLAFGGFQTRSDATSLVNYPIDDPVSGESAENRPMLAWIFSNEEYTELYHTAFSEFISEYFDTGYFQNRFDTVSEMISPYVENDPTKFCTFEEFEKGISALEAFCVLRAESVSKQLNGSIGTTSESQDVNNLVNAESVQIDDMGSMGRGMGGDRKAQGISFPPAPDNKEVANSDENASDTNIRQNSGDKAPQNLKGNMPAFNEKRQPGLDSNLNSTDWPSLTIYALILVLGLLIMALIKRKKGN